MRLDRKSCGSTPDSHAGEHINRLRSSVLLKLVACVNTRCAVVLVASLPVLTACSQSPPPPPPPPPPLQATSLTNHTVTQSGKSDLTVTQSGKSDLAVGESVNYQNATIKVDSAGYYGAHGFVVLQVAATGDGAVCPTAGDIYLLSQAGQRIPTSQSKDSCQALNKGERGSETFVTRDYMSGSGTRTDWLTGSKVVFAPGGGSPVARWSICALPASEGGAKPVPGDYGSLPVATLCRGK